ncbi:MAG: glycosyltransferase [Massilia sp.]|nr:glycosyltransferase [Massilia sp.]
MRFLFVHQNFPGQFRHVANHLAGDPQHTVVGVCDAANLARSRGMHKRITIAGYRLAPPPATAIHPYLQATQEHVLRAQTAAHAVRQLLAQGFDADVVVAHPGWGEALFLRELLPRARHVHYCEYFYHADGADVGFDPEFPAHPNDGQRIIVKNATQLLGLPQCDAGIAPTRWQRSLYPQEWRAKIAVLHEGIDTTVVKPDPLAHMLVDGIPIRAGDEIVTFVARNLEPYRGFHTFMRALAALQGLRPAARVVIVGGDEVSYGRRPPAGLCYRHMYTDEINRSEIAPRVDWSKVHFLGNVPYAHFVKVLQVSAVHVYLTYPFVLSWSMLEAMAAGCLLVASNTHPVQEFIRDGENGLLVDFFDAAALARTISQALEQREALAPLRSRARAHIVDQYELTTRCGPAWVRFLTQPAS